MNQFVLAQVQILSRETRAFASLGIVSCSRSTQIYSENYNFTSLLPTIIPIPVSHAVSNNTHRELFTCFLVPKMPKVTSAKTKDLVKKYVREFENETFKGDGDILYCVCCETVVSTATRFLVTQHIKTAKHKERKGKKAKFLQTFVTQTATGSEKSGFDTDLCRALVRADIPFHKLSHPEFKGFLEKYTGKTVPHESSLRKSHLDVVYNETLNKIRDFIKNGPIWVSMDETTDVEGRYVVNTIVGKLSADSPSQPFLLNCEVLEKCNHATIARYFNECMSLLWPGSVQHERVLLFLTDGAPYMVKAGSAIKIFYPKLIHLTCLAHALHRVAETVRFQFPDIDELIATVKKIFLKAPSRVEIFKMNYPQLPLPPQPIITRWGTWLSAAEYYCMNFNEIQDVLSKLPSDSAAVEKAKSLIENPNLKQNLAYLYSNAVFLGEKITSLEKQNLALVDSIAIVTSTLNKLNDAQGENGGKMKTKIKEVLEKNPGWKNVQIIADILCGKSVELGDEDESIARLSPTEAAVFKYAPITSVDVERSFSRFKSILRPNRRSFLFENLKKVVVCNCNSE